MQSVQPFYRVYLAQTIYSNGSGSGNRDNSVKAIWRFVSALEQNPCGKTRQSKQDPGSLGGLA